MTKKQLVRTIGFLFLLAFATLYSFAQRIEVHFDKEFSNDSLMNKTIGVGGA